MTQHNNYHPCTSILIEALRNMEGGDKVLKEWDKQRQIVDKEWQAAKSDSESKIAELEARHARDSEEYNAMRMVNIELQAHINVFREALRLENFAADSWANAFYNAFQYIKNLRNGLSDFDLVIYNLNLCEKDCQLNWNKADAIKILSSTPAQHINDDVVIFDKKSLVQHDDEVIERCAVIADNYIGCDCLARDIRKLKGK